jgi:hypothetical protein
MVVIGEDYPSLKLPVAVAGESEEVSAKILQSLRAAEMREL